ncbi:hypothetical protein HGRIS_005911 [Hohenbuehelia grisea]|uniref:RING-type E3 ubiquitin transferase n=1 Tax=Hohenbuehelia grisea TaxID=104357 RepID=A0ABR3K0M2_9AGAR
MGQASSSRGKVSQNVPDTTQAAAAASEAPTTTSPSSPPTASDSTLTPSTPPSESRRKPKSSTRKSILRLVRPKDDSAPSQKAQNNGSGRMSLRKSWRNSRRWSKARADVISESEAPKPPCVDEVAPPLASSSVGKAADSDQPAATSSNQSSPQQPTLSPESTCPPLSTDALHSISEVPQLPELSAIGPIAPSDHATVDATSVPLPSDADPVLIVGPAHETLDQVIDHPADVADTGLSEVLTHGPATPSPDVPLPSSPSPTPAESPAGPQPAAQQQPSRQFPPPGTLVVVQGVVHTTDVPRTNANTTAAETSTSSDSSSPQLSSGMPSDAQPRQGAPSTPPRPSTPVGPERSGTRNRLSALLRRPASAIASRPPSTAGESNRNSIIPVASTPSSQSQESSTATTSSPEPNALSGSNSPSPEGHTGTTTPASEPTPGSISSSSIDVLGTLLSVAAAATAASLLTGSSEPILSSGLAPSPSSNSNPNPNPNPNPHPNPPVANPTSLLPSRPTSPTPTAGLGGITTTLNNNQDASASRTDRMRSAWDSLRDRLGLRNTSPTTPSEPNLVNENGVNTLRGRLDDPRELMLAEMTRAFNMGLGLNESTNSTPQAAPAATPPAPANGENPPPPLLALTGRAMPPEGSFERFLVDLQVDLRVALTQPTPRVALRPLPSQAPPAPPAPPVVDPPEAPPVQAEPTLAISPDDAVISTVVVDDAVSSPPHAPIPLDDLDDMPTLATVSDSSDEEDDDHVFDDLSDFDYDSGIPVGRFPTRTRTSEAASNEPPALASTLDRLLGGGNAQAGAEATPPGRINWWRTYRFPAIPLPRPPATTQPGGVPSAPTASSTSPVIPTPATSNAAPTTSPSADTPVASAPTSPPIDEELPDLEVVDTPPTMGPPPPSAPRAPPRPSTVVPVIIVGLQSVSVNLPFPFGAAPPPAQDDVHPPHAHTHAHTHTHTHTHDVPQEEGVAQGQEDPLAGSNADAESVTEGGQRRERPWRERAADALRNLRSGSASRRPSSQPPPETPSEPTGSRTFLIYVIGGYYPPDHSIVTGGPNNLESFEALLELAELLGQVKPPTVSKEEIEKSGLQIIKPAQLEQCEKDGVISSNCIDRCLICLDDYAAEDDIRVMACKHGFHKDCVDRWLQTGRNNCPACRSKGVSTEEATPAAAATPAI